MASNGNKLLSLSLDGQCYGHFEFRRPSSTSFATIVCEKQEMAAQSPNKSEICIGWRNLQFELNQKKWCSTNKKRILNRLNGCFEYHTLNAFMGPSGAGKTTLLNCLNGNRVSGLTEESEIYMNRRDHGKVVSYFIQQHVDKTIVGRLKVGEILRYAFQFKNSGQHNELMDQYIRATIDELLLDEKVLDRYFEKCSGGEQKRIAIAQELMSLQKPTLLFVDEPTTGLDSNAAHLVMKCLRQLATNYRMTVITSIHVPSDEILNLFDKLYVLAKGGVCIYSGRPDQLRSHLETEVPDLTIAKGQPPIEALLRIACNDFTDPINRKLAETTLDIEYRRITHQLSQLTYQPNGVPDRRKLFSWCDFALQTKRFSQITFVAEVKSFLFQLLILGYFLLMMIMVFSSDMIRPNGCYSLEMTNSTCRLELDKDSLLNQNLNFHGMCMTGLSFVIMCLSAMFISPIIQVFQNEHRNQWYSLGVFFASFNVVELVRMALTAIVHTTAAYFLSSQYQVDQDGIDWNRFALFGLFNLLMSVYMQTIGQLIGTLLVDHSDVAVITSQLAYSLVAMFTGYFIDIENTHNRQIYFLGEWFRMKHIFNGIVYSFYGYRRCNPETEFSLVLQHYRIDETEISSYPWMVLANVIVIKLVTMLFLYYKFNSFVNNPVVRFIQKRKWKRTLANDLIEGAPNAAIFIDYPVDVIYPTQKNNNNKNINSSALLLETNLTMVDNMEAQNDTDQVVWIVKQQKEIEFEQFSRGKIIVCWRNLSLYGSRSIFEHSTNIGRQTSNNPETILQNLNGQLQFGTLNALMGTSGAGKTSLLKVLNGRDKDRLSIETEFHLSKFTRIQTCFITQDVSEHFLPGLTAKQMLVYASRLKNAELREYGLETRKINHEQIALNLLNELGIRDTENTLVERCSGGERKRLALALELTALQMPNLICIDEPTSGLDSNSAEVVVACLRKLTQTHSITIVTSIHQPNIEVLHMFDQIYVLARGGVCIYSGAPAAIQPQLSAIPEISTLDTKFPIETLIKHSCRPQSDLIVRKLLETNDQQFTRSIVNSGLMSQQTQPVTDGIQRNRRRFALQDTWILCLRYMAHIRGYLWFEWAAYIALYLMYGGFLVYFFNPAIALPNGCLNLEDDFNSTCFKTEEKIEEENSLANNLKYIYFVYNFFIFFTLLQCSLSFSREIALFYNEHRNGWYSSGTFYLMKCLFDTIPIIVVIIVYVYISNIYEVVRPGIYPHLVYVLILCTATHHGLAHIFTFLGNGNISKLIIITLVVYLQFSLVSNFFMPVSRMHYVFQFISNFSVNRYSLELIVLMLYGFERCREKEIATMLYQFSLQDSDFYYDLVSLIFLLILYRLITVALLLHSANPAENRRKRIERISNYIAELKPSNAIVPGLSSHSEFRIKQSRF